MNIVIIWLPLYEIPGWYEPENKKLSKTIAYQIIWKRT